MIGRAAVAILIALIRVYQVTLGPLFFSNACRFDPSCSRYTIGALRKYGFFRGTARGIRRVCRCHPWDPGGYDPP
jgi:uncharacterized protein